MISGKKIIEYLLLDLKYIKVCIDLFNQNARIHMPLSTLKYTF